MMVRVEDVIQIKYDCVCAHVCVYVFACVRGRMRACVGKRAHTRVSVYALCACVQQKVSIERVSDAKSTPPTKYFRKYLLYATSACIHGSIFAQSARMFGHYCNIMLFNAREIG